MKKLRIPMVASVLLLACALWAYGATVTPVSKLPSSRGPILFTDGFETGDLSAWTFVVPGTGIEVVFFDLGDTLVALDPGSGLFVLRVGALETVNELKSRGIRVGIITNVPSDWDIDDLRAVLAEPEFLDAFEVVALSSEAPAPKPDPSIYLYAHSLLVNAPSIARDAFVGETLGEIANMEPPTEGARAVGMVGIHLSDVLPSPLADYTIETDELPSIVDIVAQSTPDQTDDP